MENRQIELVIFDWAGTTTDFGSQAPVQVFDRTFSGWGIHFTRDEINAPMGMEKKAHIRSMLSTPAGRQKFREALGRDWNEQDIQKLYEEFETTLGQVVGEYSIPIPGVNETVQTLREMGLRIGSTTGYTSEMMRFVLPAAQANGYAPDCVITPDCTGHSRPSPFMVYECMRRMNVYPASQVVKVGDTAMDILEGKNAGAWSVGILVGSNLMGLSQQEYLQASPQKLQKLKNAARIAYEQAGADLVIETIRQLPEAIRTLNQRLCAEYREARA